MTRAIHPAQERASRDRHWSRRIVESVCHHRAGTTGFFMVLARQPMTHLPDESVPPGARHRPRAEREPHLPRIEPAGPPDARHPATAARKARL